MLPIKISFTILDYQGIAIVFFVLAAIGGVTMIFKILFQDEKVKKEERIRRA